MVFSGRHSLAVYALMLSAISLVLAFSLSTCGAMMRHEIDSLIGPGKPLAWHTRFSLSSSVVIYLLAAVLLVIGIFAAIRCRWHGVLAHALIVTLFAEMITFFAAFVESR